VQKILRTESAGAPPELADDVLQLLKRYQWPGNIRQLASVLRTACVMAEGGLITRAHLSDDFVEDAERMVGGEAVPGARSESAVARADVEVPVAVAPVMAAQAPSADASPLTLEELELQTIRRAVDEAGGNISVASKRLGISRNTIYRKLRWRET
jgi:transcriptional regulator of acetoin/glycerol metabolism